MTDRAPDPSVGARQQHAAARQLPPAAQALVARLGMQKIPHEGPWFAPTYRSPELLGGAAVERYDGARQLASSIYALLTQECFSALHRLRTDEIWHFYAGTPVCLFLIHADGLGQHVALGSDVLADQQPQCIVPRGTWMAALPGLDRSGCLVTDRQRRWHRLSTVADYTPGRS